MAHLCTAFLQALQCSFDSTVHLMFVFLCAAIGQADAQDAAGEAQAQ
jgi:hypothetical protein